MIWQTNEGLNKEIHDYGCYWMVLIWHAARFQRTFVDTERLLHWYDRHTQMGWMRMNCFVLNPTAVLRDLGVKATMVTDQLLDEPWKLPASYACGSDEFEALLWKNGDVYHFVAGDGLSHVTYDPYGVSRTVSNGKIVSKRVFRRQA